MRASGPAASSPASERRSARSFIEACLEASSYFHSVTNRHTMAISEIRKVMRIEPGIEPPVVESTRGWISDSASRTARKFSGTKAPPMIANTAA